MSKSLYVEVHTFLQNVPVRQGRFVILACEARFACVKLPGPPAHLSAPIMRVTFPRSSWYELPQTSAKPYGLPRRGYALYSAQYDCCTSRRAQTSGGRQNLSTSEEEEAGSTTLEMPLWSSCVTGSWNWGMMILSKVRAGFRILLKFSPGKAWRKKIFTGWFELFWTSFAKNMIFRLQLMLCASICSRFVVAWLHKPFSFWRQIMLIT